MSNKYFKTHWVECDCLSPEHCIRYGFNTDDKEAYVEPFLDDRGFWWRLWQGVKYIFGHKSNYGHFDCVVMNVDTCIELRDKLDEFVDKCLIDQFNNSNKKIEGKN